MIPDALPDDPRAWLTPVLLGALVAGTAVAAAGAVGPFAPSPTDTEPSVTALEVTDRGCRGDLQDRAGTSDGPNGSVVVTDTIETTSPRTELTAAVARTSPAQADFATYRVELTTHEPPGQPRCAGQVAYRVAVRAPDGPRGTRVLFRLDGRPTACSGGGSGDWDPRCGHLLSEDDWPRASTNATVTG